MLATNHVPDTPAALELQVASTGNTVLASLLDLAASGISQLTKDSPALAGRVRGAGPDVSFSQQIKTLERDHPVELVFPFEGSDKVGGAVWRASEILSPDTPHGIAKLKWLKQAGDLPMHAHACTDRFIIVLEGRGFFHCSTQTVEAFDGSGIRTIAARAGDVFAFRRGVMHTFSTCEQCMTLISCHLPFLALDDPDQYTLPHHHWCAEDHLRHDEPSSMKIAGWVEVA